MRIVGFRVDQDHGVRGRSSGLYGEASDPKDVEYCLFGSYR